jgi:hypothetical protein
LNDRWKKLGGKKGAELGMFRDPNAIEDRLTIDQRDFASSMMFGIGAAMKAGRKFGNVMDKYYHKFRDRPKNVIAKAIAKLRSFHSKLLKATEPNSSFMSRFKDPTMADKLKKAAHKVAATIDKLLLAMQRAANA